MKNSLFIPVFLTFILAACGTPGSGSYRDNSSDCEDAGDCVEPIEECDEFPNRSDCFNGESAQITLEDDFRLSLDVPEGECIVEGSVEAKMVRYVPSQRRYYVINIIEPREEGECILSGVNVDIYREWFETTYAEPGRWILELRFRKGGEDELSSYYMAVDRKPT
ncbi:MAG: hypothetical protein HRU19_24555 [Pseudobacteriovorax sp.]|nr:hypothetical protein [Pseudobacteriovorax sp.]